MEIRSLSTTQVILVRFDEIPLNKLNTRRHLDRFSKRFEFGNVEVIQAEEKYIILCQQGIHKVPGGEQIIDRLNLEERKIVFKINSSSEDADEFFASLTEFLAELAGVNEQEYLQPILKAEESEIIAHLDFSIDSLISPTYLQFIDSTVVNEASSEIAEVSARPMSLVFQLEYLLKEKLLSDHRITLAPKEFRVEPRKGYPLTDQVFYSKAPFDTNTHIELLQELEKTITQTK